MIPLSFDPLTARKVVGDDLARLIESKARADADAQSYEPPVIDGRAYWDQARAEMQRVVYFEQFRKRLQRNQRKQTDKHGD